MMLTLGMTQRLVLQQRLILPFAPINWSPVQAFAHDGGLTYVDTTTLNLKGLSHEGRLKAIDDAGEVFRYHYGHGPAGDEGDVCFRIPLLRDRNIDSDSIRERISRHEYDRVRVLFENVGRLERIVRAVPYGDIYRRLKTYVEGAGHTLDDVVLVGIDRGGRIPAFLAKAALGHSTAYFLKIDQGDGYSGGPDTGRLMQLAANGVFRGRFVVFVDSTVDSGRQIMHLERWFDDEGRMRDFGHTGWVVAGSNENGETLAHHVNINWGVDPDQTFEDDVLLLGMAYSGGGDLTKVRACPSPASRAIRSAFMAVPRGVVLDVKTLEVAKRVRRSIELAGQFVERNGNRLWWGTRSTSLWQKNKPNMSVQRLAGRPAKPRATMKRLAIIGSHEEEDKGLLPDRQARHIVRALAAHYKLHVGTLGGLPGLIARTARQDIPFSEVRVFQRQQPMDPEGFEVTVTSTEKLEINRLRLIGESDAVLVLPGNFGTLTEAMIGLSMGKHVITIKGYGKVSRYLERHPTYRRAPNLHVANSLVDAIAMLKKMGP